MKTTERFEKAVKKLYLAFHKGTLNAYRCEACAVGNILGHGNWKGHTIATEFVEINRETNYSEEILIEIGDFDFYKNSMRTGIVSDIFIKEDNGGYWAALVNNSGYSAHELMMVEKTFLTAMLGEDGKSNRETQFEGLCAVVKYLCKLDSIPNPLDYSRAFEREETDAPKYELEDIFS